MGPEAVRLLRALKKRYPNVEAGTMVDPYSVAYDAALDPDMPSYGLALRVLLKEGVLKRNLEYDHRHALAVGINQHYEVTSEGARLIADS